jgi:hypothetical protein
MKQNKAKLRPTTIDVHLQDAMRIGILGTEPNVNSLAEQRHAQVSH